LTAFGLQVLEKKILKNYQCNFTLSLSSTLAEGLPPSFEKKKLESPSLKNDVYQV
jgi:hypothetical protein